MNDYLIWLDLEMTGLDPEEHVILEIASIITDSNLQIIAEGPDIVIHHSAEELLSMDEWSKEQHMNSGLIDKVKSSTITCEEAESLTLEFLSKYTAQRTCPLCGNSVWQDRHFLIKHMPRLEDFFHYRNVDVSTIKELVKRWYPNIGDFKKEKRHLALSDIKESIRELQYYRKMIFR